MSMQHGVNPPSAIVKCRRLEGCKRIRCALGAAILALVFLVAAVPLATADAGAADPTFSTVSVGEPAIVRVWNRPVVELRATIGRLTPPQRAEGIEARIQNLPPQMLGGDVVAIPGTLGKLSGYWIRTGERNLLALLPEDLDPESGLSLEEFAKDVAMRLREVLQAQADQRRLPLLLRGAVFTVLATVVFLLALWGIARLRRRALRRLATQRKDRPLHVRGINLRPYLRAFEEGAVKLTALAADLLAGYVWLTFALLQFPYSQPWGDGLGHWLHDLLATLGSGALDAVPGFFTVIIIFLATRLVVQATDRFFRSVEVGWLKVNWLEAETARATRRLAIVLIWIFALTVAYPYIPGSHSDAFKGVSVFVGLMISLGSAGFVNQLMSGLVIVYSRALKPGDYVQVADSEGTISEVGMLSTKLVTPIRHEITIPNAVLVGTKVTNYSRLASPQAGSIIATEVTIGYDTSWRQVHAMLEMAAKRTSAVSAEPKPVVIQRALSDFYVAYQLMVSVDRPETRRAVLSELHANIQDVFNEFGVQIMSPNFVTQPAEKVWVPKDAWHVPPVPSSETP